MKASEPQHQSNRIHVLESDLATAKRELGFEAALEKVRTRTMQMKHSAELSEVAQVLLGQLQSLGLNLFTCTFMFVDEAKNIQRGWTVAPDGNLLPDFFDFPLRGDPVLDERFESWKKQTPLYAAALEGKANKEHHRFLTSLVPASFAEAIIANLPDKVFFYNANFSQGYLFFISLEAIQQEDQKFLIRFAKVFEQTYTRFLDLQKAEAQAREAHIEAALERVRGAAGYRKSVIEFV
jgi:hypothetical protein